MAPMASSELVAAAAATAGPFLNATHTHLNSTIASVLQHATNLTLAEMANGSVDDDAQSRRGGSIAWGMWGTAAGEAYRRTHKRMYLTAIAIAFSVVGGLVILWYCLSCSCAVSAAMEDSRSRKRERKAEQARAGASAADGGAAGSTV